MKDYTQTVYGIRSRTGPCELPIVQQVTSRQTTMMVLADVKNGDHKKPNRNSWRKMKQFYPDGSQSFSSDNLCWNYSWRGPQVLALNNYLGPSWNAENEVYNRALAKLYAKARGDLDLSVSFFERHQTVRMFKSLFSLKRIVDTVSPNGKHPDFANNWLMWQYGIRPLVSDIYAASRKLVAGQGLPNPHIRTRAAQAGTESDIYGYFGPAANVPQRRSCEWSYRTMFDIVFDFKPSVIASMAGFSSLNPISIAWELLPYSFVADWLINIGGYIRNTESALLYGTAFRSGYYTNTHRIIRTSKVHGASGSPQGIWSADCDYISHETSKDRVVLSSTPFPRPPSFHANLGASRLISAAALLIQPLSKLGKIR